MQENSAWKHDKSMAHPKRRCFIHMSIEATPFHMHGHPQTEDIKSDTFWWMFNTY